MKLSLVFRRLIGRVPSIGDVVWWAPKQIEGRVVSRDLMAFVFQGGEKITKVKNPRTGSVIEMPRWTVRALIEETKWDADNGIWIVGEGPAPKNVRGLVIKPNPVKITLKADG